MDYIPEIMKYSTKKIKYITPVSINEMRTSKLVNSILENTNEHNKYKLVFDVNGTLVERTYDHSFSVVDYDNGYNRICAGRPKYISPPSGYEKWNGLPPQFITYTRTKYLKSIYKDIKTNALKKEVFFLDDLLMICKEDSFNSEDGTENMVWNSLEETCRGNVA